MDDSARDFYDDLAADYRLLFADWSDAIAHQGRVLDRLVRAELGHGSRQILDCACGIGTQAIGLAQRGHRLTASDLSPVAAQRAASEALVRHLPIPVVAADMRHLPFAAAAFDVVVCADNAIAHLSSGTGIAMAATTTSSTSSSSPTATPTPFACVGRRRGR